MTNRAAGMTSYPVFCVHWVVSCGLVRHSRVGGNLAATPIYSDTCPTTEETNPNPFPYTFRGLWATGAGSGTREEGYGGRGFSLRSEWRCLGLQ